MKNKISYTADFYDGGIFHVYNRTNNKELLFKSTDNRLYFLKQFQKYLRPFLDIFCWNLLPNHFHFLVQIKSAEAIKKYLQTLPPPTLKPIEKKYLTDTATTELLLELGWKRFFNSYAMAFNKQHKRNGNLFQRPFKRIEVMKESHFTQAIIYIHANAQHHKLCNDFTEHKWSSWLTMLSNMLTHIKREEVIAWFGGKQQFIDIHKSMTQYYYNCDISIEEYE
jgi:REP element-mobilizing transposase RayT